MQLTKMYPLNSKHIHNTEIQQIKKYLNYFE